MSAIVRVIVHTLADLINARVWLVTPNSTRYPQSTRTGWRVVGYSKDAITLESLNTTRERPRRHQTDVGEFTALVNDGRLDLEIKP